MATDSKRIAAEALLGALAVPGEGATWAQDARAAARTRFLEMGAPIRRDEYWKYTDPSRLTAPLALAESVGSLPDLADPFDLGAPRLIFANGRLRADLSDPAPEGATVIPMAEALSQDLGWARDLFGALEAAGQEKVHRPLAALNTAAATEGAAIEVTGAAGTLHIAYAKLGDGASPVRHLVQLRPGASLTLLESGAATNTVLEVDIPDGAQFQHVRVQEGARAPAATHLFIRLGAGAEAKTFTLTADGDLTRNEVVMEFTGDDASGHIAGAVLGKGGTHIDNTVFVTHGAERCESRQVFKNVLTDTARGVFQGKIFVREGAQKTDGYQISQSVLLADGAEFLAKPELEIYADDVACSHGSTTGTLDETALFYLRSRGVPEKEAEALLVSAFVDEAIAEIAEERLAEVMRARVAAWMASRV